MSRASEVSRQMEQEERALFALTIQKLRLKEQKRYEAECQLSGAGMHFSGKLYTIVETVPEGWEHFAIERFRQ